MSLKLTYMKVITRIEGALAIKLGSPVSQTWDGSDRTQTNYYAIGGVMVCVTISEVPIPIKNPVRS